MVTWLYVLCAVQTVLILLLLIKVYLMRKSADEICEEFTARLENETNTLLTISSGDRSMRRLAARMNGQLRILRKERLRFLQGDREVKEAITNISHDLRTPLTAICGYLDLLDREEKSDTVGRYLARIENRTAVLKQLTEELLRYSVAVSAREETAPESIVLNEALEESMAAYYAALKEKGITPDISLPSVKVERRVSRSALARILGNVISNAVAYSDGDLSVVLKEDGEIIFSNKAADMTPVIAGRLFDRFFTVETGRASAGLGLSIAKLLTEQAGGTITAACRDGRLFLTLRFYK